MAKRRESGEGGDASRYFVIDGRKWRRTDPTIPPRLRRELVRELMAARRAVRSAADPAALGDARQRVQDAKLALGERGRAWWLPPRIADRRCRIDAAIRVLLRSRQAGATACPSEPARIVGGINWRAQLDAVRSRAATLARRGELVVSKGGRPVSPNSTGVLRYGLRKR